MIKIIKSEIYKLKRSHMVLLSLAGASFAPLLNLFIALEHAKNSGNTIIYLHYVQQSNVFVVFVVGTLLYGLITTYVFNREFEENMYKHLLTVPISKNKIFISKIILASFWILVMQLFSFMLATIISVVLGFENLSFYTISKAFFINIKLWILFIPLVIPNVFITFLFRGFVAPIVFNIVAVTGLVAIASSKYAVYYPWIAPALALEDKNITFSYYTIINLILLGIVSFIANIIYMNKKDIC